MEFTQYVLSRSLSKESRETARFLIEHYEKRIQHYEERMQGLHDHYNKVIEQLNDTHDGRVSDLHSRLRENTADKEYERQRVEALETDYQRQIDELKKLYEESRERDCTKLTVEQIKTLRRPEFVPPKRRRPAQQLKLAQSLRDAARNTVDVTVKAKMLTKADAICTALTEEIIPTPEAVDHVNAEATRKNKRQFVQKIKDEIAIDNMLRSKNNVPKNVHVVLHDQEAFRSGLASGKVTVEDKAVVAVNEFEEVAEELSDRLAESTTDFTSEDEAMSNEYLLQEIAGRVDKKREKLRNIKATRTFVDKAKTILAETDVSADEMITALTRRRCVGFPALTG